MTNSPKHRLTYFSQSVKVILRINKSQRSKINVVLQIYLLIVLCLTQQKYKQIFTRETDGPLKIEPDTITIVLLNKEPDPITIVLLNKEPDQIIIQIVLLNKEPDHFISDHFQIIKKISKPIMQSTKQYPKKQFLSIHKTKHQIFYFYFCFFYVVYRSSLQEVISCYLKKLIGNDLIQITDFLKKMSQILSFSILKNMSHDPIFSCQIMIQIVI